MIRPTMNYTSGSNIAWTIKEGIKGLKKGLGYDGEMTHDDVYTFA